MIVIELKGHAAKHHKAEKNRSVPQLESTIDRLERRIRQEEATIKRIFIEAESHRGLTSQPRVA